MPRPSNRHTSHSRFAGNTDPSQKQQDLRRLSAQRQASANIFKMAQSRPLTKRVWLAVSLLLPTLGTFIAAADTERKLPSQLVIAVQKVSELPNVHASQLAFSPDGNTWAAGQQQQIAIYQGDKPIQQLTSVWLDRDAELRFSKDGTKLAAGGRIYSLPDGKELFAPTAARIASTEERGWEIDAAALSPDLGQALVWMKYHPSRCCREDGHRDAPTRKPPSPIFAIDTRSGTAKPLPIADRGFGEYRALAVSSRHLVVGGVADKASVFDRATLAPVATLVDDGAFYSFRFSADEKTLAAVHLGRWINLYDGQRFTRRARIEVLPDGQWISALAISQALPIVAASGWDGVLRLYSAAAGDEGRLLFGANYGQASALAFSPSGAELLVAVSGPPGDRVLRLTVKRQ